MDRCFIFLPNISCVYHQKRLCERRVSYEYAQHMFFLFFFFFFFFFFFVIVVVGKMGEMSFLLRINVKKIAFGNKEHATDQKMESRFYWDSS